MYKTMRFIEENSIKAVAILLNAIFIQKTFWVAWLNKSKKDQTKKVLIKLKI